MARKVNFFGRRFSDGLSRPPRLVPISPMPSARVVPLHFAGPVSWAEQPLSSSPDMWAFARERSAGPGLRNP